MEIVSPLRIPLTIENINDFIDIMAVLHNWEITTPLIRISFLCEAGQTTEANIPLPKGYSCTRSHPLKIVSDYYDKDILVQVYIDDEPLGYGTGMALTSEMSIGLGKHFLKRKGIKIEVTNNTSTDATVTIEFPCHIVEDKIIEQIYIPLLKKACQDICGYIGVDIERI